MKYYNETLVKGHFCIQKGQIKGTCDMYVIKSKLYYVMKMICEEIIKKNI